MDFPDIPDFLRVENRKPLSPEVEVRCKERMAAARPASRRCRRQRFDLPKSMEPVGWALLKQIERQNIEKQKARLAARREQAAKRQRARR